MGKLEHKVKIRTRKAKLTQIILTTLAVSIAGALSPTMLVSKVLRELKSGKQRRRLAQNSIYAARRRLLNRGIIEYRGGLLRATEQGKALLRRMEFGSFEMIKPKHWDKKWRMLVFDISEERKSLREKVRKTLVSIGFKRLQDSVWVFPFDCEDLIVLLKADFHIGKDLLYIIADTIENDAWLKKEFGLD
jgi:DNA-binding transcriptional regulator PaaX